MWAVAASGGTFPCTGFTLQGGVSFVRRGSREEVSVHGNSGDLPVSGLYGAVFRPDRSSHPAGAEDTARGEGLFGVQAVYALDREGEGRDFGIRTIIRFFAERFVANIVCTGLVNPQ